MWKNDRRDLYYVVICHLMYNFELQMLFLKDFGVGDPSYIYSYQELQYTCESRHQSAGKLFANGDVLEIDRHYPADKAANRLRSSIK